MECCCERPLLLLLLFVLLLLLTSNDGIGGLDWAWRLPLVGLYVIAAVSLLALVIVYSLAVGLEASPTDVDSSMYNSHQTGDQSQPVQMNDSQSGEQQRCA